MRRSILVGLLTLICLGAGAPQKKKAEPKPLPPLNEKVYEFARKNLGQPVGDGICITLAVEAIQESGAKRFPFDRSGDYVWGELVPDFKDVLPGDILQFRDANFKGQRTVAGGRRLTWHAEYAHHTAIVAKVEREGKLIKIYHQNVVTEGHPESEKGNVQEGELRMESLQKGGWVKAYRPMAPDPPALPKSPVEDRDSGS